MHIYRTIEDCEYLLTIIDMPLVRLVGPVESDGSAIHVSYVLGTPSAGSCKIFATNNFHLLKLSKRW